MTGDASVKRFDATTGASQETFVKSSSGGLHTPHGIIFDSDGLLVVDQNANRSIAGEILVYSAATGKLLERLVPHEDPDAPAVPRGMILWDDQILFVGNLATAARPNKPIAPGTVSAYTKDGAFVADLTPDPAVVPLDQFHATGVVVGPDGLLYVSNVLGFPTDPLPGQ